jgi:tetratricopeptide (TPR) repeat protein
MNRTNHPEPIIRPRLSGEESTASNGAPDLTVKVRSEELVIPTYLPAPPDLNPMFLERRVYQGSSGKVYPLPFTDRISETKTDRKWRAVWIENEFLRALVLPELGGRIHVLQDKTNGYDLIYNQPVIRPALVGLAGPWISGGIEFNWPQHHRPATFLPVDFEIEEHADGSKTIWCSDHDPMTRMKGMHGVCLHPHKAYLELKVRAYNRTPFTQTFLWWANVATRVHEAYQSFFPPDVYYIADHAKRAMSEYPHAKGHYYGVNYGERARTGVPASEIPQQFVPSHCRAEGVSAPVNYQPDDLSFYANIPVPTSYMCMGSQEDFFGGYDYAVQAGIVHIANHHISPGKKQWTWGYHEFGYAWDRYLTDADAQGEFRPYIEIMAGVYTDNQPDFSFLQPGETKTWSQYWYPIQKIGPAQHANLDAAISLLVLENPLPQNAPRHVRLGISVTREISAAQVILSARGKTLLSHFCELNPGAPFRQEIKLPRNAVKTDLRLVVLDGQGREIIAYQPRPLANDPVPPSATEPAAPEAIASTEELYLAGLHLDQYRHATRSPEPYWREAVRRDPEDSRSNNALGLWHLRRGEFGPAEKHFRTAIARLTRRNPNPSDGEAHYNLGLCRRFQLNAAVSGDEPLFEDAYAAFYKATWNQAWAAAGYHALAEMDCVKKNWAIARDHLNRSLRFDTDNLRARNLLVLVLRKLGQTSEAEVLLAATLQLDRLDSWARHLHGDSLNGDLQTRLDLAHDYARAGFLETAIEVLVAGLPATHLNNHQTNGDRSVSSSVLPDQSWGAWPLIHYTIGWLQGKAGGQKAALKSFKHAATLATDYCFPARLEEIAILQTAMVANPKDARAPYYLGNLLYDRRRHAEAMTLWERSAKLDGRCSIVWRNLGIGYFNVRHQPAKARAAYDRALRVNPTDARLLYERDQLWKRLGEEPEKRLRELLRHLPLVQSRDDLSIELSALFNQTGQPEKAAQLVASRQFQPWEGGEGGPLGQHVRAQMALGRAALNRREFDQARQCFEFALSSPRNLSEARHLLANQSDLHYWLGCAYAGLGDKKASRQHWLAAATFKGDFQEMSVRSFSEMTCYSALAWEKLNQRPKAKKIWHDLLKFAQDLEKMPAKIDYFATSLPTMLLFEDDLQFRQQTTALFLQAQAQLGLGKKAKATALRRDVLQRDPNHALAADLLKGIR